MKLLTKPQMAVILLAFAGFCANSGLSQTAVSPDSALQTVLAGITGTPISLRQSVEYASANSTALRRAEATMLAAKGSVRRESGNFDPRIFVNLNHLDQNQPTASFFSGASVLSTQQTSSRSGLRMMLPIGTQLEFALNTLSLKTNSTFASLNPEYDAFGSINLRQPLLGGFAASARKRLTESEREADAAQARYDQELLGLSTDVEGMYWDLYAAERNYAVQVVTRDRTKSFLSETELRAKAGLVGPDEVANARTFLAQQELLLIDREEQLDRQSDRFASMIGKRPGGERFITSDTPGEDFPVDSVSTLLAYAGTHNLELQALQREQEAARGLAGAAGWEALPSLDLVGSLGGYGLGGEAQQVYFNGQPLPLSGAAGTFGDALNQVAKRNFGTWSVGVELNIPIGFRSGLGERDRLEAIAIGAEQNTIDRARLLEEEIRSTYRELTHGKARMDAARQGVDAAQEQTRIGLIEFRNGRKSAFELVRLGEDLALAQQRYSDNLVRTAKAAATLRRLTSGGYPGASH